MQTIFLTYLFCLQFLYFERNFFGNRWKLFGEFVITLFFVSIGTYWGKIKNEFCERKLIFYTILGDCEENFGVVVNTAFTEAIGSLCRPFFWNICFFYQFCTLSANFSDFRWKLFGEFVITLFFVSIGTYWGTIKNEFCGRKEIFIPFSETPRKTSAV